MNNDTKLEYAHKLLTKAFETLMEEKKAKPSRENSETLTLLETAMMWNNKDRAVKGELEKSDTHIQQQQ